MPRYFLIFVTGALLTGSLVLAQVATTRPAAVSVQGPVQELAVVEPSAVKSVSLQFFGDIMLDRNVARQMGKRGLDYIFAHVVSAPRQFGGQAPATATPPNLPLVRGGSERLWGDANLTIANLEGPFAPARVKTSKSIVFRFDPKLARQLKNYGLDGFSLANNHTYDMGWRNVEFTRRTLVAAGLGYFGDELKEGPELTWYWKTSAPQTTATLPNPPLEREGSGGSPSFQRARTRQAGGEGAGEVAEDKVAFIGLHNTYHQLNLAQVKAALQDAKQKARYVIVNVHWGEEYKPISNKKQRDLARWLIDQGATAVIGHHPHVVQEVEIYKDRPIFYSLGNFIFDQYFSGATQEGLSVKLLLQGGVVQSAQLIPFYSVKSQVYKMEGERRERWLEWMQKNSRLEGREIVDGVVSIKY